MTNTELPVLAKELDALATLNIDDDTCTTDTTALSTTEKKMLAHHENLIEQGKMALLEVGRSLLAIQRGKLYRTDYTSFNEYCRKRWGIGRQRGYELINATVSSEELAAVGVNVENLNERQHRAAKRLKNANDRAQAFARAQELAGDKKMTSRHVEEAVDEFLGIETPVIEVEAEPVIESNLTCRITPAPAKPATPAGIANAIDGLRDIALTLKVQDHFDEPLQQLEAMIEEFLKKNPQEVKDFAGTVLAA